MNGYSNGDCDGVDDGQQLQKQQQYETTMNRPWNPSNGESSSSNNHRYFSSSTSRFHSHHHQARPQHHHQYYHHYQQQRQPYPRPPFPQANPRFQQQNQRQQFLHQQQQFSTNPSVLHPPPPSMSHVDFDHQYHQKLPPFDFSSTSYLAGRSIDSAALVHAIPITQKQQWCFVDRVGGQFVPINSADNLPMPEKPPTDLSHYSHSPPNLPRYNADRRRQFASGMPKALEKLDKLVDEQERIELAHKDKRQKCS